MENAQSFTIQLTSEQKELFDKWLAAAQKELEVKLDGLKSLRRQTANYIEHTPQEVKSTKKKTTNSKSWSSKSIIALEQLGGAQTSAQVIKWLIENDDELANKDKRYVTKNVTSKLAILVDAGKVEKKVIAGKNVYMLKDQG